MTANSLAALFAVSLLAAPVEYLAHEGAHFLVARAFGAGATLHYDRVMLAPGTQLDFWENVAFAGAGPLVDWAVGIAALWLLVRRYTVVRLGFAIWLARPLQFLPALLGIDTAWLGLGFGLGTDLRSADEAVLALAVGLSPQAFLWIETLLAAPLLAEIVLVMPPPRLLALAIMTAGVLAGWAGWLVLGPYLLP